MKRALILLAVLCSVAVNVSAQSSSTSKKTDRKNYYYPYSRYRGGFIAGKEADPITGDTTYTVQLSNIVVYRSIGEIKKHKRLIRNVKAVYPYALEARRLLFELNERLEVASSDKEREEITEELEDQLIEKYTPVLEKMTFSQGKILIRLINRETSLTTYQIVKDFRGNFSAKFWNVIARIFRANLKQEYDPTQGEDKLIEQIIILYEAGIL